MTDNNDKWDDIENQIRTIGVLTSGGDAPGMNAAIRAVVRSGISKGFNVRGIRRGYQGLLNEEIIDMKARDVSDIIQRGGTILQTARCQAMLTKEGQLNAAAILKKYEIDAVVVIGGDGSFKGAQALSKWGVKVVCIPGTIDLDIACTNYSIGFDTAVNTAMEAIDKIRDTSTSHERCSIIEVMGRAAGYIGMWCGIANGAEKILIPEEVDEFLEEDIIADIVKSKKAGKRNYIIINAEGVGDTMEMAKRIEEATGIETRATILGHMQRGGSPSCKDRVYASMMGSKAAELLDAGKYNRVIAYKDAKYIDIDLDEALAETKHITDYQYHMTRVRLT
jgi:6-phosphofructokinase 1